MFYGWRVVAGAFAGMAMSNGFFTYAFTVMVDPIRAEFAASLEQVMYSLTIGTLLGLAVAPITGQLVDRFSVRAVMTIGSLLSAAGFYLMASANSITFFNLATGLTMSLSMAMTGTLAGSTAVSRWFTRSLGKAMGIAATGVSVGGIVVPALVTYWLEHEGWRGALLKLSLSSLFILTPIIWLCIRSRPSDVGLTPEASTAVANGPPVGGATALNMQQIVRMPAFWLIGLSMGLVFAAYASMLANLAPYSIRLGYSEEQVSSLIALLAFGGLAGKLVFGFVADRINLKVGLWIAHAMLTIAFGMLILEPPFSLLLLAGLCFGLSTGGLLPIWNALVARVFGVDSFGRALGAMAPILTLSIIPAFVIVGRLFDSTGSYTSGLILFSAAIGLAALILVPLRVPSQA